MAAIDFQLNAEIRTEQGKGASRRLRRDGKVPAILYGARKDPQSIVFDHNELLRSLEHEAFYSHILTINLGGEQQQAIIKDLQRHPARLQVMHMDLQRVSADEEIRVNVPLHFINEETSVGVKEQGGVISHNMIDVEIACLPKDLPEYIDVDVQELELNASLHLSDIKLPEGVRIVALSHGTEHDLPVVAIHHARVTTEEELAAPVEGEEISAEVPTVGEEKKEEEEEKEGTEGKKEG
ncbi:MAG: 50S ribosomal protein L25/general stress protein Ctc [Gammaproteobacteria bacterium]|nr:50S ribosomal protein L25/general stress protein Ctc [Gammaproteobacteria bacterium]